MVAPFQKDRRSDEEKQRQADYEEVLSIMKEISSTKIVVEEWTSKTTNEVIKMILYRWGVNETLYNITNDNTVVTKASRLILINDLLEVFTVNEIMILMYYTFNLEEYNRMMENVVPEAVEQKYVDLSTRLNVFIMGVISKFNIDKSILNILPDMSIYKFSSESQIRILWYNRLIGIEVICKYGNLYSEEFTDYVIDHIICKSKTIGVENKRKDYLLNIYTLMNSRFWIHHSEMFKQKHKDIFEQVAKIQVSRTYGLMNNLIPRENEDGETDENG